MPTKDYDQEKQDWEKIWTRQSGLIRLGRSLYNRWWTRLLLERSKPTTHLLEIGCGTASLHPRLAPHIAQLTGVDYAESALGQARVQASHLELSNCTYVAGDAHHLPFPDGSFDLVWSQGLLEHYESAEQLLREHLRVCAIGGTVMISLPFFPSYLSHWYALTRPRGLRRFWPWTEQGFFTEASLGALIESVGVAKFDCQIYRLKPKWSGIIIGEIVKSEATKDDPKLIPN